MRGWRRRRAAEGPVDEPVEPVEEVDGESTGPEAESEHVAEEPGQESPEEPADKAAGQAEGEETDPVAASLADSDADSDDDPDDDPDDDTEPTVRLTTQRFERRRRARRRRVWRRVVVGVLALGVVVGAVWLVFFSSVLAVRGVQVVGAHVLSDTTVERAAAVPEGGPLATADLDAVTRRVEALPAVKSVDVSRSWPNRVRVAVTERRAVAVVQDERAGSGLQGVSADGVLFRRFAKRPARLPMIHLQKRVGRQALAEAAAVAGALPADLAPKVAFVRVATVDTITLQLRNGHQVQWGTADQSVDKGRVLAVLLHQHAAFYDVSVPGRPTIRR